MARIMNYILLLIVPVLLGGLIDLQHFIADDQRKAGLFLGLGFFVGIALSGTMCLIDALKRFR